MDDQNKSNNDCNYQVGRNGDITIQAELSGVNMDIRKHNV